MTQDNNVRVETAVENLKTSITAKRDSIVKAELTKIIRMEGYKIKLLIFHYNVITCGANN